MHMKINHQEYSSETLKISLYTSLCCQALIFTLAQVDRTHMNSCVERK